MDATIIPSSQINNYTWVSEAIGWTGSVVVDADPERKVGGNS